MAGKKKTDEYGVRVSRLTDESLGHYDALKRNLSLLKYSVGLCEETTPLRIQVPEDQPEEYFFAKGSFQFRTLPVHFVLNSFGSVSIRGGEYPGHVELRVKKFPMDEQDMGDILEKLLEITKLTEEFA